MEIKTLYHVPPSRYTLATVDWFQGPDRGSRTRFFDWLVELDGIEVDIRGGRYGITRREWHVFSEEVAPYAGGRGASRARSAVAWRQDTSAEAQATSGAVEAASRSQAPGDAGATEAQD